MRQLFTITSRNLKQYLRDRGAVFFSLLSMLIVIMLMLFFLGDSSVDSITDQLAMLPGRDTSADKENATVLMLAWTCAGIIGINAVTVTLSCLNFMIKDRENGKLNAIYTAPVSRLTIAAGYILAAWLASVLVCSLTLVLTEVYCVTQGMAPYTLAQHLQLLGMICVNSFTYAALMYFVASLVKTTGAWGGLGTVIGTLVGFLGGIYLPVGSLSDSIVSILKCTPVLYGTAMFRSVMTQQITDTTFAGVPAEITDIFREAMGIDLYLGEHAVTLTESLGLLAVCGLVFLSASVLTACFRKKSDR